MIFFLDEQGFAAAKESLKMIEFAGVAGLGLSKKEHFCFDGFIKTFRPRLPCASPHPLVLTVGLSFFKSVTDAESMKKHIPLVKKPIISIF